MADVWPHKNSLRWLSPWYILPKFRKKSFKEPRWRWSFCSFGGPDRLWCGGKDMHEKVMGASGERRCPILSVKQQPCMLYIYIILGNLKIWHAKSESSRLKVIYTNKTHGPVGSMWLQVIHKLPIETLRQIMDYSILIQYLVGGWTNPSEKYARQNGFIFPK